MGEGGRDSSRLFSTSSCDAPEDADGGAYRRPYGGEDGAADDAAAGAGHGYGYAPPGGAFGNDDALDRELQGVRREQSNGYANGPSAAAAAAQGNGYSNAKPVRGAVRDDSAPVAGDGLSHQF